MPTAGLVDKGEALIYDFRVTSQVTVDITVRISSKGDIAFLSCFLDGLEGQLRNASGNRWTNFKDYVWRDVDLTPRPHRVDIHFKTNQINICSFSVKLTNLAAASLSTRKSLRMTKTILY